MSEANSLAVDHRELSPLFVSSRPMPTRKNSRKRTHSQSKNDALKVETQYEVTQAEEDVSNTTIYLVTAKIFLFSAKGVYVGVYFDQDVGSLAILEPIQSSTDDEHILNSIVSMFQPEVIVCNSKVALKLETLCLDKFSLEVKTLKDFQLTDGEEFINKFVNELNKKETYVEMLDILCQLMILDEYPIYCHLMAAFGLYLESLMTTQNIRQISDVISVIDVVSLNGMLNIDRDSMYSLSIIKMDGQANEMRTLSTLLNKTSSKIGRLTINNYLMRPMCDIDVINERLNTVECILKELGSKGNNTIPQQITFCLQCISDINRTLQCLRMGNFDPNIWKQLRNYSINVRKIKNLIELSGELMKSPVFAKYVNICDDQLAQKIQEKLDEMLDFETDLNDVSIKQGIDLKLDEYLSQYSRLEITLNKVAQSISSQMGMTILIGYFPQMGYIAFSEDGEISVDKFELIFKTGNTAYYKTPQMIEMDNKFGDIALVVGDKQSEILYELKEKVIPLTNNFVQLYPIIGEIDALITFGKVAFNNKFCKPQMTLGSDLEIQEGFNPLLDVKNCISNPFEMDIGKVCIMTGPNFSGKSTMLIQIGIIVFLSHIGCFVPASSAKIGIVESILTRIATLETVSRNQSTFMRDCVQMGKCINKLKTKSLVLIDEFGKGTDIIDGQAMLASVIRHYIYIIESKKYSPRVFIATHMIEIFKNGLVREDMISHYQMKVLADESHNGGNLATVTYLYQLVAGMCRNSFGIYCMEKNGIDVEIVKRAKDIQQNLNTKNPINCKKDVSLIESTAQQILEIEIAERIEKKKVNKTIGGFAASIRSEIRHILD